MEARWRSRPSDPSSTSCRTGSPALKGFASDVRAVIASAARRLAGTLSQQPATQSSRRQRSASRHAARRQPARRRSPDDGQRHRRRRAIGGRTRRAVRRRAAQGASPAASWFRRQPIVRFFSGEPAAPHSRLQPDGVLHPRRRHPLSRLVPHLADRRQARRAEDAGQDHRRRHRRQRHGGARAHRARSQASCPTRPSRRNSFPDDGLAALELSIHPRT